MVTSIALMPFRHEAYTLLRSCAAECRVVYLMRTLLQRQIRKFMQLFNELVKKGFEAIIGANLPQRWWRVAQLQPKYGGMAMRTGLYTHGAHHLTSLTKTASSVARIVGDYDLEDIVRREIETWLRKACGNEIDILTIISEIKQRKVTPKSVSRRWRVWNPTHILSLKGVNGGKAFVYTNSCQKLRDCI